MKVRARKLLLATSVAMMAATFGCGPRNATTVVASMQEAYAAATSLQWHGEVTIHRFPEERGAGPLSMLSEVALERPGGIAASSRLEAAGQTGMASELYSDGTTAWLSLSRGEQPIVFKIPAPEAPMALLSDDMVQLPELFEGSPVVSPIALFYGAVDLAGARLTLADETQTIDGVECRGVTVQADDTWAEHRLWIGREDDLLHGLDFTVEDGGGQRVEVTWRASGLQQDTASPKDAFAYQPPADVEIHEGATFSEAYDILRYGIGKPAADFSLKSIDGKRTVTLADLKGKPVVLDFWATWCGPCELSQPALQKLHEEYGDRVHVLMISDESPETIAPVIEQRGLTIRQFVDPDHKVMEQFGISAFPTTIYLDAEGVVLAGHSGVDPDGDIFAQLLEPLKPVRGM